MAENPNFDKDSFIYSYGYSAACKQIAEWLEQHKEQSFSNVGYYNILDEELESLRNGDTEFLTGNK